MTKKEPLPEITNMTNSEVKELQNLFEKARETDQEIAHISDTETRKAYYQLQSRIATDKGSNRNLIRYAVAALILIGLIGTVYIFIPQTISVQNGNTRTLDLSDGTTVTLNSGSKFSYPRWFNIWSRTVSLDGEAFFEVSKSSIPFKVETGNALITVMGTTFNVRSWIIDSQEKTSVYLKEGSVSFSSKTQSQQAILLEPGQTSSLTGQKGIPLKPQKTDQTKALAWMQNILAFENQPLSFIFEEISRRFNVQIKVPSTSLAKEKLTIYITEAKSVEQILDDISKAKNLQYSQKGNIFTVSRP